MEPKRSWWQQINRHPVRAVLIAFLTVVIVLIILSILGYNFNWDWTGLGPYISPPHSKDSDFQRGKTLWDWLQILFIPAILTLGALWFTSRQNQDREISLDNQREVALQAYIDKMSELILEKNLRESQLKAEVRDIARVRTLTILPQLDSIRKGSVLRFLAEAGLISTTNTVVGLSLANLRGADLHLAILNDVNLYNSDLRSADLRGADLSDAELIEADLYETRLGKASMQRVNLTSAGLAKADLSGAKVTEEQLKKVKSLKGATMPDGSKHE